MKNLTQKLASGKLSLAEFAKEYWTICTTYLKATDKPGLSDTAQTDSLDLLRPALERMKIQPGEKQGEFLKWLTHSPLEVNPDIRDRVTEYLEYLYGGKAYDEDWNEVLQARIITNNLIAEEMLRGRNPEEITNEEIDRTFPNSMMKHFSDSQLAASILLSAGYVLVNGVWQKVSNRIVAGVRRTIPQVTDAQVGKKLADHAADYGLPMSKEGASAYKAITNDVLSNATEIRIGPWKTLGQSEFYIRGNDVAIVNNGNWVSTFPLTNQGTIDYIMSLPLE